MSKGYETEVECLRGDWKECIKNNDFELILTLNRFHTLF